MRHVEQRVRAALSDYAKNAKINSASTTHLRQCRAEIVTKIGRVVDAIETMGSSETLAKRLTELESRKAEIEADIAQARKVRSPAIAIPDALPSLFDDWRQIVGNISNLAVDPHARPDDVQDARRHLHSLLGPVAVEPRDGVLWAHLSANVKSLVETRLSGGLHINSQKVVAGAGFVCSIRPPIALGRKQCLLRRHATPTASLASVPSQAASDCTLRRLPPAAFLASSRS